MKAIALISGGLDSILAAKVVVDCGIEVVGVNFRTPFTAREKKMEQSLLALARDLSRQAGIELKLVSLKDEFLDIVRRPAHGYGSNINTCIDCRILMLRLARKMMEAEGASFLITGEVVAQRDMSQKRATMRCIDREAGVEGLVLRPLSAKLMEETIAEKNGWIKRARMFDFNGRSRKPQIDLAVMLGLIDFPNAAGGCLLTDPRFSDRVKDLMKHGGFTIENVELIKQGRHFRFSSGAKFVVGRNAEENAVIESLARDNDLLFFPPDDIGGPTGLGRGNFSGEDIMQAARILCRYCDRKGSAPLVISYRGIPGDTATSLEIEPADEALLDTVRV